MNATAASPFVRSLGRGPVIACLTIVAAFFCWPAISTAEIPRTSPQPETKRDAEVVSAFNDSTESVTQQRLMLVGVAGLGLLLILLILFAYLKLNHASRGFYSRRLQTAAAILIGLVLLLCYWLLVVSTS